MENKATTLQTIIIDDDLVIGQMQIFMLKKLGIENPLYFSEGRKALDYLERESKSTGNFFVMLDLNMPIMNGWEFLEIIKAKPYSNKLYIVIVTSSLFKDDYNKAEKYPQVIGYFQKSLSVQEFKAIIALQEEVPQNNK